MENSDDDSMISTSTLSEHYSGNAGRPRAKKSEFQHLVCNIFEQIRLLYKLSALLRRPVVRDKYIRSVSKDETVYFFAEWDCGHVKSKFPNANEVLVKWLGLANTRRRQQLKYWDRHPQNEPEDVLLAPRRYPGTVGMQTAKPASNAGPEERQHTGVVVAPKIHAQRLGVPSKLTKQSFSTVAESTLNDNETFSGRSRTTYEPSFQGHEYRLRTPDVPKAPFGTTHFNCPYCYKTLEVKSMRQRRLWK